MADLFASLAELGPDERRILQVVSVVCESVGQTKVQQVLILREWQAEDGTPLSKRMEKTLRERLLAQGLLVATPHGYTVHPDLREPLTREAVLNGSFQQIVKAAERVVPTQAGTG